MIFPFDHAYCMNYKPQAYRRETLLPELYRAGFADGKNLTIVDTEKTGHDTTMDIFKDAIAKNYGGILVMENDIRFLKGIEEVRRIFSSTPEGADIANYDPFIHFESSEIQGIKDAGYKWATSNAYVYGASCYYISARGMRILLPSYEYHSTEPCDSHFFLAHQDLFSVFSLKNVCCQLTFSSCDNGKKFGLDIQHDLYGRQGLDYSLYNVPSGFGAGKVINEKTGEIENV